MFGGLGFVKVFAPRLHQTRGGAEAWRRPLILRAEVGVRVCREVSGRRLWVDPPHPDAPISSRFLSCGHFSVNSLSVSLAPFLSPTPSFARILRVWVPAGFSLDCPICLSPLVSGSLTSTPWLLQNVPHKTPLPEGMGVGSVMRIRGVVPDKASR